MNNRQQLLLGAFFVAVLSMLGYYTMAYSDFNPLADKHELLVHFPDAAGLRAGDTVLVAGMREGKLDALSYDPSAPRARRITAVLAMEDEWELREGFAIHIEDATMLGGKQIAIDPGPAGNRPIDPDAPLLGVVETGALAGLGEMIDENRQTVTSILTDIDGIIGDVRGGTGLLTRLLYDDTLSKDAAGTVASAAVTFQNLEDVTERIQAGQGLLGSLVSDDALRTKVEDIAANLQSITTDFRGVASGLAAGKGTLGRILEDEQLSEDVAEAVATIREVAVRINSTEGTLGRLIADGEIADRIESVLTRIDEGEGSLGRLLTTDEIYDDFAQVAEDLAAASAALRNAEGTLGLLVFDDGLYRQVEQALEIVTLSLEEYREAAPTTTFTSVLFGAF
jgi:phospholipid/cholesterol/gamma-HCH transport system substrate-binding protein